MNNQGRDYKALAEEAARYCNEIRQRAATDRPSYQLIYDEHQAKAYVYDSLWAKRLWTEEPSSAPRLRQ